MGEDRKPGTLGWIDLLLLAFLLGLALLSPIREVHKQLILLAIGIFQLLEGRLVAWQPGRGRAYSVIIKILLSTLLLGHTGEVGINSSYYPIYYLPVVTAAMYFGPIATMLWTALASLAYCSLLLPAMQEYEVTPEGFSQLGIRILFFFLAGMLVNRFATENKKQVERYQTLSEQLAETNRELRRAQEEARRAERLAALGQLSAGLAHEIRNPLGIIKGSAEMLGQNLQEAPPLARELAANISSEVNRLNALVARFLDFARPSRLDLRPLDIRVVVDHALETVRSRYPNARVTVERYYAGDLPKALADEQFCELVFVNLILNAFEAIEGHALGILRLTIAADFSRDQPAVSIEVRDNGPGVPAEIRQQIFNPFFTAKSNGVGLGLSIVAKIVDDHRGLIQLQSDTGNGACFRVVLPAATARAEA